MNYFHNLTGNEYKELEDNHIKWYDLPDIHPQPIWCQYPNALNGPMGCWSLIYRKVTDEDYCKDCECYEPNSPA